MFNPRHYYRPKTLEEALKLAQPDALMIAGGALTFGVLDLPYETIIDLQDIPELKRIEANEGGMEIGGAVTLQQLVEHPAVHPVLKRSITRTLPLNLRNNTTVMESLTAPNPPREWWTVLVAHDVGVSYLWDGNATVSSATDFLTGAAVKSGFVTRLHMPNIRPGEALGAAFVARTPADEPIVNAAVFAHLHPDKTVDYVYPAVCGASEGLISNLSLHTLNGSPLTEAAIASAVKLVAEQVNPVSDYKGSADYRREMARVTVQRALLECMEQLS